jgi:outer membrane protein insertion porin family
VRVFFSLSSSYFFTHNGVKYFFSKRKIIWFYHLPAFFLLRIIVYSLGGDLFWVAGASLITHIPRKPHWPVKAHAFLNAGQLEPLHRHEGGVGSSLRSSISAALSQPSVSTGVGLIYHYDSVRVELNFGVPLAARASDGTRKGVQVGIGFEFL